MKPTARALGLERNIVAVSAVIFLLALGENLWKRFVPKYLEALGAPVTAIGLFGSCQDLLDGIYQYPVGGSAIATDGGALFASSWRWRRSATPSTGGRLTGRSSSPGSRS
jgi:hypothetical protein